MPGPRPPAPALAEPYNCSFLVVVVGEPEMECSARTGGPLHFPRIEQSRGRLAVHEHIVER